MMKVRPAVFEDAQEWRRLRAQLWPGAGSHEQDILAYFSQPPGHCITLVLETSPVRLAGFIEAGLREFAEGCDSSPVAYIEGWYVEKKFRKHGHGRALVEGVVLWARDLGLRELASDCHLRNRASKQAHLAAGFAESARILCFRRPL